MGTEPWYSNGLNASRSSCMAHGSVTEKEPRGRRGREGIERSPGRYAAAGRQWPEVSCARPFEEARRPAMWPAGDCPGCTPVWRVEGMRAVERACGTRTHRE